MKCTDMLTSLLIFALSVTPGSRAWLFPTEQCCSEAGGACFSNSGSYSKLPLPKCFATNFMLYTNTATQGVSISTSSVPSEFKSNVMTHFIIHGWNDKTTYDWVIEMRTALLAKGDFNVITVDWADGATTNVLDYRQAAANTRVCGKTVSVLMDHLKTRGVLKSNLHCIGHSLGGHACGYAGQSTALGWITGLDPAGPEFVDLPADARLSSDDADFVDVIQTNGGTNYALDYGSPVPMGHVDFYPNGGERQPGCWNRKKRNTGNGMVEEGEVRLSREVESSIVRETIENIGCSHFRAIYFYISSIQKNCFKATAGWCSDYDDIPGSCQPCVSNCPTMGFDTPRSATGLFYVPVTDVSPYYVRDAMDPNCSS